MALDRQPGLTRLFFLLLALSAVQPARQAFAYSQAEFDSVTTDEEQQVGRVREQEIAQLKIVLGRRFAESRRPDILLRLAELYIERYRFYFFKENQIHQQQYKQGLKPKSVGHARSHEQLKSATNACLAILKSRVRFAKLDQVYYFLGYNAEEMGNRREAMRYFETVVTRYPSSSYAPEAYRNLAEAAFENKKYTLSLQYYEKAAQFKNVPSYPRTLYKLAWAYFKNRRKSEALETMKKVIGLSGSDEKFVGLRDEALGDIVMFFSEAGRSKEAHEYFSQISGGPEIYVRALSKLSKVYENRGDYRLAIRVNDSLITEYGDKRPELIYDSLGRNVELYRKVGDGAGEEAALGKLVEFYSSHSGDISKNEDALATYVRAKNYLRGRATDVHKEAQKHKSAKLYSRAADLYSLYIKAFLQKPADDKERRELSEIRTYRSDALLAAARESEALPELEHALREEGDAKHRKEAGTTLLNVLIKRLDAARAGGKEHAQAEKQFLDAAEIFERVFPDDKLVIELQYKRARLAAAKSGPEGLSKEARNALSDLVQKYPSRAEAADAAHDLVADAVKRKEMEDATKLAQQYLANSALMSAGKKSGLGEYLRAVVSRQSFSNVQNIEKDKEFSKAAAEYERLATQSASDQEVASKALNNAAVNYERGGGYDDAVRVYLSMLSHYPGNPAPRDELKRIASQFLWKSRFHEAAKLYTKLSGVESYSHEERLSFLRTAFWLDWGTGDLASAFLVANSGLHDLCESSGGGTHRKSKKPSHSKSHSGSTQGGFSPYSDERCHDLAVDLGRLLLEAGRFQEGVNHLKSYVAKSHPGLRKAEASYMLGALYQQLHEGRKAGIYYEDAAQAVSKRSHSSVRERNFAAHAAFLLVEPYFTKFAALKLELPESHLKTVTRQKLDQLEGLVTRYTAVVAYGDGEWGIAALERIYDVFSTFSAELDHAPVPAGYDAAKTEQYRRGIRSVSEPMAARAVDFLKQGYQKGLQLQVTTPTFIALTQRLSRRFPREYPPVHFAMVTGDASKQSALRLMGATKDEDPKDLLKPDHEWRAQIAAKLAQNPKNPDIWVEFGNLEALAGRLKLARLLYEQAVSLGTKSAAALNNLSVVLFLENRTIEASQGFVKAAEIAEFTKDVRLNLAKSYLAFHHFSSALEHLRALSGRFPQDADVNEALVIALLGSGQVSQAASKMSELGAESSKQFSLWYNWCVWALLAGNKGQREKAMDLLKDRRDQLGALEKTQADLALAILSASEKEKK